MNNLTIKILIAFLLMSNTLVAHEFMKTAPNGHRYDSRMWRYNKKLHKVVIKPEYEGMSQYERFKAAGIPHHFDDPKWIAHNEKMKEEAERRKQLRIANAKERANRPSRPPVVYQYYWYYYTPYYQRFAPNYQQFTPYYQQYPFFIRGSWSYR